MNRLPGKAGVEFLVEDWGGVVVQGVELGGEPQGKRQRTLGYVRVASTVRARDAIAKRLERRGEGLRARSVEADAEHLRSLAPAAVGAGCRAMVALPSKQRRSTVRSVSALHP